MSQPSLNKWINCLKPITVQTSEISTYYEFEHLIGSGAQGKVYLGTPLANE